MQESLPLGPGSAPDRRPFIIALTVSLLLHLVLLGTVGPWRLPRPAEESRRSIGVRLTPSPSEAIPTDQTPEQAVEQSRPAEPVDPPPEPAPEMEAPEKVVEPSQRPAEPRLNLDSLLHDTVKRFDRQDRDFQIQQEESRVGDSAFDPRLRKRLRESEDINTHTPKKQRVRSYQADNGDVYVEVGDGNCFRIKASWEAGVHNNWEMVGCMGSHERLKLDPRPWMEIKRDGDLPKLPE